MIKNLIYGLFLKLQDQANEYRQKEKIKKYNFDHSVSLSDTSLVGNISIEKHTYANKGCTFSSGENSRVIIGKYCAIGRYVHITSKTHAFKLTTADEKHIIHEHIEIDTIVGDYVWIGDHVFIKHGVTVGDYAIIGANSVVTKNVKPFEIVGGIPAKHIRFNTDHYRYEK